MDDRLQELVSRAVDGDLSEAEAAALARRAAREPELAAELEAARRLRDAVAHLAGSMTPPEALDAVMEPLCRSAPVPEPRIRPALRWLGIAAALVLGATVALEMARRNPAPAVEPERGSPIRIDDDDEIFALAPLPTADPDEPRPFGASDRLLAESPPSPDAPEPEPLQVVGPLPADGPLAPQEPSAAVSTPAGRTAAGRSKGPEAAAKAARSAARKRPADAHDPGSGASVEDRALAESTAELSAASATDTEAAPRAVRVVEVLIGDRQVWSGTTAICEAGRNRAAVTVRDGIVTAVEPVGDGRDWCRPEGLIGSRTIGVADGVVEVTIVVGSRPK